MKPLLTVTAAVEVTAGVGLLASPAMAASILLGATLDAPGVIVARVAGAALVALGFACGRARQEGRSRATTGIVTAMMFYNVAVAAILTVARFGAGLGGWGLWPAVIAHVVLAGWCLSRLRPE